MKKFILAVVVVFSFSSVSYAQIMRDDSGPSGPRTAGSNYNDRGTVGTPAPEGGDQARPHPSRHPKQDTANSPSTREPQPLAMWEGPRTPTGIPLNSAWKKELNQFAIQNVVHPAWGYSHAERNYHQTLKIASTEGIAVDEEVVFAAAFLHDIGGLPAFEVASVDHAVRSAEIAIPLLQKMGFPPAKLDAVKQMILGHTYYGPKPTDAAAQAFRDADMLDFLGPMGVSRLLAATAELGETPTIQNAVLSIRKLEKDLPQQFSYPSSKVEAQKRIQEADDFLSKLDAYSYGGNAY